jgi:hypothetical protein
VLHNGKPIDDLDGCRIYESSTIALSAALPGLFGAAFRRQGTYAALRPQQTALSPENPPTDGDLKILVKLFNMTARELGPTLLEKGVEMNADNVKSMFDARLKADMPAPVKITVMGRPASCAMICDSFPAAKQRLRIRVTIDDLPLR